MVVRLKDIEEVDTAAEPGALEQLSEAIESSVIEDILAQFNKALAASFEVEINQRVADSIFQQAGSGYN